MRSSVIFTADGRLNTKSNRIYNLRRSYSENVPPSYKNNTTKEELCFEYINAFIEQFQSMYPQRRIPYMIAENEYGVRKFVCSTMRPTQLPITELYDMYECASFLSGYIIYEPLDPPVEPPKVLVSPTMTIKSHTGDCFDLAMLLASFLIANGYDAYVVYGYAPKFIALRDQSQTLCPLASSLSENEVKVEDDEPTDIAAISGEDDMKADSKDALYIAPDNGVKDSNFKAEEKEKIRLAGLDPFVLWNEDAGVGNPITECPNNSGAEENTKCVHAWVLIRAGKRDVKEHLFLEPSTGRAYSVLNSPYLGVENVWNNVNFWILLNNEVEKVSEVNFDFANETLWEYLFISPEKARAFGENGGAGGGGESKAEGEDPTSLSVMRNQVGGNTTYANMEKYLDPPPSWVVPLSLERSMLLLRYPPAGKRTVYYLRAKVDYFAKNTHPQGMVMRISTYLDNSRVMVKEIHEWYENRKDKMYKRVRHMLNTHYFIEYFHPGSCGEVKQWLEYPGKRTDIQFHVNGRTDRLKRRVDVLGTKSVEYFENRIDKLSYRATYLTTDKSATGGRHFPLPGHGLANEIYILKMMTLYDRNTEPGAAPSGSDVAKRTFFVKEGKAVFQWHFSAGKITSVIKTYPHTKGGGSVTTVTTAPPTAGPDGAAMRANAVPASNAPASSNDDNPQDDDIPGLQEAAALERDCYSNIKSSQMLLQQIVAIRREMEGNVVIDRTVFEAAFEGADKNSSQNKAASANDAADAAKGTDYLSPYLRHINDIARITKEEALEIRQVCLDALKARLVERANIIQSRLNEENSKLARKQEQFQRSQREGDLSTEEYESYCTQAMFRIQILEERLGKHEETALKKFADLDAKLAADVRLRVLRNV